MSDENNSTVDNSYDVESPGTEGDIEQMDTCSEAGSAYSMTSYDYDLPTSGESPETVETAGAIADGDMADSATDDDDNNSTGDSHVEHNVDNSYDVQSPAYSLTSYDYEYTNGESPETAGAIADGAAGDAIDNPTEDTADIATDDVAALSTAAQANNSRFYRRPVPASVDRTRYQPWLTLRADGCVFRCRIPSSASAPAGGVAILRSPPGRAATGGEARGRVSFARASRGRAAAGGVAFGRAATGRAATGGAARGGAAEGGAATGGAATGGATTRGILGSGRSGASTRLRASLRLCGGQPSRPRVVPLGVDPDYGGIAFILNDTDSEEEPPLKPLAMVPRRGNSVSDLSQCSSDEETTMGKWPERP